MRRSRKKEKRDGRRKKRKRKRKRKRKKRRTKSLKKKNKFGELTLPDFKPYYKTTVMRTVWYHLRDRHID